MIARASPSTTRAPVKSPWEIQTSTRVHHPASATRVLILGMNYAPEVTGIAPYTTGLAEHLAGRGHHVTVATTFPHYPRWRVEPPHDGRWRLIERRNGVEVRRGAVLLPDGRSAFRRMLYDTSLAVTALLNSTTVPRADLVFCVSPPIQLGLAAWILARRWHVPLVLQVKDLPVDAALAVGMLRPGRALALGRALERLVYRCATRIVVISEGFRHNLVRQGVPPDRIVTITDWSDTDRVRPMPADPAVRAIAGAGEDDFLVLHTGNMGEKQGLANALLAAGAVDRGARLCLTFVGDGMERSRLEALATERRLGNVRFLPLQPADVFPRLLASADALLLNQCASVVDSVAPSKLLSYLAAGRPVVAAVHPKSEAARVIRASRGGVIVPPDNPPALTAMLRALADDPEHRRALGARGRLYVEEHYGRDRILATYEALLGQLASPIEARGANSHV